MSKWVPREEYVKSLTADQLREFYLKSDPRARTAPRTRATRAPRRAYGRSAAYQQPYVRGRGEYTLVKKKSTQPKYGSVTNAPKGASFENSYGSRLGSVVGEGLQSLANVFGFGEYNIKQNSCLKMVDLGTSPPRVKNTNKGEAMIVNHREYLGDLSTGAFMPSSTSTAFTLTSYKINPGNDALFPFGSRIAENFQEWEIRGMLVELKSLSSNTATSLSLGSMFACTDYNVYDAAPINKIEVENMEYACSNKPTDSILMPIECARQNDVLTHLYIDSDQEEGGDRRLYDLGNLFIGSYGCPQANAPIAEIWVTYEIALYKPHIHAIVAPTPPEPVPVEGLGSRFAGNYIGGSSTNYPCGISAMTSPNGASLTIGASSNVLRFPISSIMRTYLITASWRCQGTVVSPAPPTFVPTGSVTIRSNRFSGIAANNEQTYSQAANANSVVVQFFVYVLSVDGPESDNTLEISGGSIGVAGSTSYWDLVIAELPFSA